MTYHCQSCNYRTSVKYDYERHLTSARHLKLSTACEPDEKAKEIKELKSQLDAKQAEIVRLEQDYKKDIANLIEQRDQFKSLVEKAVVKSTTTVVNSGPRITTNNLILSSEPIRYSTLQEETSKHITAEAVLKGDRKYAETIIANFLQDKEGNNKTVCTDLSRQNFQYKDESTGKLVVRPSALYGLRKPSRSASTRTPS